MYDVKQEVENLVRRLGALERELAGQVFPGTRGTTKTVRLVKTGPPGVGYPLEPAKIYPIIFCDGQFPRAAGATLPTITPLSTATQDYACHLGSDYLDPDSGPYQAVRVGNNWYIANQDKGTSTPGGEDTFWACNTFYNPVWWWTSGPNAETLRASTDYCCCTFEAPYDDCTSIWKNSYGPDIGIAFDPDPTTILGHIRLTQTGYYKFDVRDIVIPFRVLDNTIPAATKNFGCTWDITFEHHVSKLESFATPPGDLTELWYKGLNRPTGFLADGLQVEFYRDMPFLGSSYGDPDLSVYGLYTTETYFAWVETGTVYEYFNIPAGQSVDMQFRFRAKKPTDAAWGYDSEMGFIHSRPQLTISKLIAV